jgi:hypothetical protein
MVINKNIKNDTNININDTYGIFDVIFCCIISKTIGTNENVSNKVANKIK